MPEDRLHHYTSDSFFLSLRFVPVITFLSHSLSKHTDNAPPHLLVRKEATGEIMTGRDGDDRRERGKGKGVERSSGGSH